MRIEPGDYEVLVNEQRTGGTYSDLKIAVEIAERLRKSNAPHMITVRSISTDVTVWPPPASDQYREID
ncbi:hypothetical protein AB8A20_08060 [Tardiphaga sp. 604_B6_N1_1]|uniref:hypothetical protein n=1 Tax=unclassified Tardiphaga TaxID=2631404 RepID=UPI003F272B3B